MKNDEVMVNKMALTSCGHKNHILAIIPAFNEEMSIAEVIHSIITCHKEIDILVVNDGSRDGTAQEAEKTGRATVVNLPVNLGIGGAVQTGFKYARDNGYDIAFQFDADGQHMASEINKIIEPIKAGKADVVIGSRFLKKHNGYRSTLLRRAGIRFFEFLNLLLIRRRITDNTSGFRAYGQRSIHFLAAHYPTDYPEPETVILLGRNGFELKEVFVSMQARNHGQSSINGLWALYYMIKVGLSVLMSGLRRRLR